MSTEKLPLLIEARSCERFTRLHEVLGDLDTEGLDARRRSPVDGPLRKGKL